MRILIAILLLAGLAAYAQPNVNMFSIRATNMSTYGVVTGTNNSTSISTVATVTRVPSFSLQYGEITNAASGSYTTNGITNVISARLQFSPDNTNWATYNSWNPTTTNAGAATWSPSMSRLPIYWRIQWFTSNGIPVGAQALIPN